MTSALFIFVLCLAGGIAASYLIVIVAAMVRSDTEVDGCVLVFITVAVILGVWALLSAAAAIAGQPAAVPPWWN